MSTGWGGRVRWGGGACESVKGDFFASLHTGALIVSRLSGGDGSECYSIMFLRMENFTIPMAWIFANGRFARKHDSSRR